MAKAIAKTIRSSNDGLPNLKAMGLSLPSPECVQMSMNLTDFRVASLRSALHAVERETARYGIQILESELVGLIPRAAWDENLVADLKLKHGKPEGVLEVVSAQKALFRN